MVIIMDKFCQPRVFKYIFLVVADRQLLHLHRRKQRYNSNVLILKHHVFQTTDTNDVNLRCH